MVIKNFIVIFMLQKTGIKFAVLIILYRNKVEAIETNQDFDLRAATKFNTSAFTVKWVTTIKELYS